MSFHQNQGFKVCPQCGLQAPIDTPQCMQCGHAYRTNFSQLNQTRGFNRPNAGQQYQQPYVPYPHGYADPNKVQLPYGVHSTGLAILFHFLLTGGGQMYNKQIGKGFVLLAACIVATCTFWPIGCAVWILTLVDCILVAQKLNNGRAISRWEFF